MALHFWWYLQYHMRYQRSKPVLPQAKQVLICVSCFISLYIDIDLFFLGGVKIGVWVMPVGGQGLFLALFRITASGS